MDHVKKIAFLTYHNIPKN